MIIVTLIDLTVVNGEMMFTSFNDINLLCTFIQTRDDMMVQDPKLTTLQLQTGVENDRISIDPSDATITILDDDSMFTSGLRPENSDLL